MAKGQKYIPKGKAKGGFGNQSKTGDYIEPRSDDDFVDFISPKHPWHRQPTETPLAYSYFRVYREMGVERSLRSAGKQTNTSQQYMSKLANMHDWAHRAQQYDIHIDNIVSKNRANSINEVKERHLQTARELMQAGRDELIILANRIKYLNEVEGMTRAPILKPAEILALIKEGAHLERLVMGDSTENVQVTTTVDTSQLTKQEIKTLYDLLNKVGAQPVIDDADAVH